MAEEPTLKALQEFYANLTNFGATYWDLQLVFGQIAKRGEQEQFEPKVAVTLPWFQAKVLSIYLQMNIFAYEKQYGKINIPPQFLPSLPPPDPETSDATVKTQWEALQKKLEQILTTMEDLNPS